MKKDSGYDIIIATVRKDDYKFLAKFFGVDTLKIIYDKDGLVHPQRFPFGQMIHKGNGKVVEYVVKKIQQIEDEPEQLDLF